MAYMMQPGQQSYNGSNFPQYQNQSSQQPMGNWQALYSMYNGVLSNMLMTNQLPQQYAGFVSSRLSSDINSPQMQQQLMMTFGNRQASPQELQQYCINLIRNYADMARSAVGNGYGGYQQPQPYQQYQQPNYYQPQQQMYNQPQQPMYDSYGRPMYQPQQNNYYTQQYPSNPYQGCGMRGTSGPASVYERAQQNTMQNQMAQYAAPDINRQRTYSSQQNFATASQPTQPVAQRRQLTSEPEALIRDPLYYDDPEYERFLNNQDAVKRGDFEVSRAQKVVVTEEPTSFDKEKEEHLLHLASLKSKRCLETVRWMIHSLGARHIDESFITCFWYDEDECVDEPKEAMEQKFDAVEKEVEKMSEPVVYKDKENGTSVTDYKPMVNSAVKVMKVIKAQGAAFSNAIEKRVVKDFNEAMRLSWVVKEDNVVKCPADMKSFADIEDLITSIDNPVMRSWDDEVVFYKAVKYCLNYSLFAIFGKNRTGYLDPTKEDDLRRIVEAVPELSVDGQSAKSIIASGNITDEMKSKLIEAAKDKFVFGIRRSVAYTNLDIEFEDELDGITDFKKHFVKNGIWSLVYSQLVFSCGGPVRIIRRGNEEEDEKLPLLLGTTFNDTSMMQRIVP